MAGTARSIRSIVARLMSGPRQLRISLEERGLSTEFDPVFDYYVPITGARGRIHCRSAALVDAAGPTRSRATRFWLHLGADLGILGFWGGRTYLVEPATIVALCLEIASPGVKERAALERTVAARFRAREVELVSAWPRTRIGNLYTRAGLRREEYVMDKRLLNRHVRISSERIHNFFLAKLQATNKTARAFRSGYFGEVEVLVRRDLLAQKWLQSVPLLLAARNIEALEPEKLILAICDELDVSLFSADTGEKVG